MRFSSGAGERAILTSYDPSKALGRGFEAILYKGNLKIDFYLVKKSEQTDLETRG